MSLDQQPLYNVAYECFKSYLVARDAFMEAMAALGLPTKNVDPLSCIAEVIAARELGGVVVPKAANPDYDVILPDGKRVQVKSLRNSSSNPEANGRSWAECTRKGEKPQNPMLDAELVTLVVFWNYRPFALLAFPIEEGERFPGLNVRVLSHRHVVKLVEGSLAAGEWPLQVIDLRQCLDDAPANFASPTVSVQRSPH